ncbi:ATP-binding protein [Chryseolinea soli]|nr:ATP-binding protein [Chryseolinea soli]
MGKCIFLVLAFVLALSDCRAQFASVEDSLETLLPRLRGRRLADAVNAIAEENIHSDLDKLDRYADWADSLSNDIHYPEGSLLAQVIKGFGLYWRGRLADANAVFQEAYPKALALQFTKGIHMSLNGLFITSLRMGKVKEPDNYIQWGLQHAGRISDPIEKIFYTIQWNDDRATYYSNLHEFSRARQLMNDNLAYARRYHAGAFSLGTCLLSLGRLNDLKRHTIPAIDHLERAMEQFKIARSRHFYMACQFYLASVYVLDGQMEKAIQIYEGLIADTEKRGYKIGMANAYIDLADLYVNQGKFAKAITLQMKAIQLFQELNRVTMLMSTWEALGKTYMKLGNYPQAIFYFRQAIDVSKNNNPTEAYAVLSELYILLSQTSLQLNDPTEAGRYARMALALPLENKTITLSAPSLNNMARVYLWSQMPDSAAVILDTLSRHLDKFESVQEQAIYYNSLGELQRQRQHHTQSLNAFEKALALSQATHYADNEMTALKGLYEEHKAMRHSDVALSYLKTYHAMKDSIYSMATSNEITDVIIQHQTAEKDKEHAILVNNELLQKADLRTRSITLIMVSVVLLFVFLLALVLVRANKINRKNNQVLHDKNQEIAVQNEEITSQNEEIELQHNRLKQSLHDLKYTQTMLIHSEKMASLGQLTAGVAHEINNPVNFISNGVEGLIQQTEILISVLQQYEAAAPQLPPEKRALIAALKKKLGFDDTLGDIQDLTKLIKTGVDRTTHIVKSLRTFSHEGQKAFSKMNLNEQLEATLIMTQSEVKGRIDVVRDYDPQLPLVECNIGEINQVFMNMIMNAIQAIREKGTITVTTKQLTTERNVRVEIADTGPGIPSELKHLIFDPFFTTKEVGKGTGLGLAISATIVEKHHGQITVESEKGQGARFIIVLPITQPATVTRLAPDVE